MSNWQTNQGRDILREELRKIEDTFQVANLKWDKIKTQKEDALAVTVDIVKRQVRNGHIQLKPQFTKEDQLYKADHAKS